MQDEQFVQQAKGRSLPLHEARDVDEHLDQRWMKRVDVAEIFDVRTGHKRWQNLLVALREGVYRLFDGGRVSRTQDPPFDDVAQFHVLQFGDFEPLCVVV
jgi:hypothetical protein